MFCVRLSVSRIMIFLFSSINIPLAKKHKSPVFFLCHSVWLVCWNFLCDCYNSSAAPGHLPQSFPGEKQGWLSIQFFFKIKRSQDLVQMCKIYIYIYVYTLLQLHICTPSTKVYFRPSICVCMFLGRVSPTSWVHRDEHHNIIDPMTGTSGHFSPTNRMETEWIWVFQSEILHQKNRERNGTAYSLQPQKLVATSNCSLGVSGSKNPPKNRSRCHPRCHHTCANELLPTTCGAATTLQGIFEVRHKSTNHLGDLHELTELTKLTELTSDILVFMFLVHFVFH